MAGSFVQAGPPAPTDNLDNLLSQVQAEPSSRSAVKPDGTRFTLSAARFADAKPLLRELRAVPKPLAVRGADRSIPSWLRPTAPERESEWLANVPEVGFTSSMTTGELAVFVEQFRGQSSTESYVKKLARERDDLAGLPFLFGSLCRRPSDQSEALGFTSRFTRAFVELDSVRDGSWRKSRTARKLFLIEAADDDEDDEDPVQVEFNDIHRVVHMNLHHSRKKSELPERSKLPASAVVPGMMQIFAVLEPKYRLQTIQLIESLPAGDSVAVDALVRMALFDAEAEVRAAALHALQREAGSQYDPKLLEGLRYPWPIIAERAADAIVVLKRTELLPKLVDFLDEPDPAGPIEIEEHGVKTLAVREVVKFNHNKNCVLCHSTTPANNFGSIIGLTARIPPSELKLPPLTSLRYYDEASRFPTIHADETYLRQDFSLLLPVEKADPWPKMQRFDFVVRTRWVSSSEAWALADKNASALPSPHQRAALLALSRLTSTYLGPNSRDWRTEALGMLLRQSETKR
jgi:hypothetical protein